MTLLPQRLPALGPLLLALAFVLTGCYQRHSATTISDLTAAADTATDTAVADSADTTALYTCNHNFCVKADTLYLYRQMPEELAAMLAADSFAVVRDDVLVVADKRRMNDTTWVQVARDEASFGWTDEETLLRATVTDDPISLFINFFSDTHLLLFLIISSVMAAAYLVRTLLRRRAHLVHFRDIDSFYPTLLCLLVATAAALYATIQTFWPHQWQQFYFHPTLNPAAVPPVLALFLGLVWSMCIVGLAVVDDVRQQLSFGDALLYLCGLAAVCATDYILFSITTLYYIGYALLAAYFWFALLRYFRHARTHYICGRCGGRMHAKGVCPHCGARNE